MSNKILSFEKNADFFLNKHIKAFESGNFIDALASIRSAIEKEPENKEYRLYLAQTLSEMCLFEESNFELFRLLEEGEKFDGDTVFEIAINLFNMGDYAKSEETLLSYLNDYPEGEHLEDAQEAYELLAGSHKESEPIKDITLESANTGKDLLDSGSFAEAISTLEPLAKNNPRSPSIQNNLALAYFCIGETQRAIEISKETLKVLPKNVHTICNLAIFYSTIDMEKAREYCKLLDGAKCRDDADLNKVLLTYCEVGVHEKAYEICKSLLEENPYEKRLLFIYAAACSNTGRLSECIDTYMRMLYINPADTIAQYYKNKVQRIYEQNGEINVKQQYIYQVPIAEIHSRLGYLHKESSKGELNMRLLWAGDENFANMLIWGLYFSDFSIKRVCAEIICAFNDERSESILRRYLMDSLEPDDIKSDIFIMMNKHHYKQPYLAYIDGKLSEVRVGSVDSPAGLTKGSTEILSLIAGCPLCTDNSEVLAKAVECFNEFMSKDTSPQRLVNKKAWAAAFVYYAVKNTVNKIELTVGIVCSLFGASKSSVERCLKLIHKSFGGKQ